MDTRLLPGNTRKERRHNAGVQVTMQVIAEEAKQALEELDRLQNPTEAERALVQYMNMVGGMTRMNARPNARFPRGYYDLVFEYGQLWTPMSLPSDIPRGTPKECFSNAFHLAMEDPTLTYVEGYAQSPMIPTLHAWVVTPDGEVIDNTWDSPEVNAYYGIAFETDFAGGLMVKQGFYGLLGNDYIHDAQMLTHGLVMDENDYGLPVAIDIGEE